MTWDVWAFAEPSIGVAIAYPYPYAEEANDSPVPMKEDWLMMNIDWITALIAIIAYRRRRKPY